MCALRLTRSKNRLRRLENHVVTLARSVSHLSSEIRSNHQLVQELNVQRAEMERMREQIKVMHNALDSFAKSALRNDNGTLRPAIRKGELNPNKVDKSTKCVCGY